MLHNGNTAKINLLLDLAALTIFLVVLEPSLTGKSIHEWLGLAFGATLLVHILLHGTWVVNTLKKFLKALPGQTRLNCTLNIALFLAFSLLLGSGIMISHIFDLGQTLNLSRETTRFWRQIHTLSADLCLILVGLHLALHWTWLVTSCKHCLPRLPLASDAPFLQRFGPFLLVGLLGLTGLGLYQTKNLALPFVQIAGERGPGGERPLGGEGEFQRERGDSSEEARESTSRPEGRSERERSAPLSQTLPALLFDVWFLACLITFVKFIEGLFSWGNKKPSPNLPPDGAVT